MTGTHRSPKVSGDHGGALSSDAPSVLFRQVGLNFRGLVSLNSQLDSVGPIGFFRCMGANEFIPYRNVRAI